MVTLTTILYEGNFRKILNDSSWFLNIQNKFITKKRLNINNIESIDEFNDTIQKFENEKLEINYVDDNIEIVNSTLGLNLNRDTHGFNYTMPYFSDLISISTDYILNVSSDCQSDIYITDDFFENSIKILDEDEDVIVTTIPWNKPDIFGTKNTKSVGDWEESSYNIYKRNEFFWFSKVMSDQVFFAKKEKLLNCDFNIEGDFHPYPSYGGFCFEKRIGNYFIDKNKFRAIYAGSGNYYIHGTD